MSDIVQTLRREKALLQAELRKDPRFVKIEHINALLTAYGASADLPVAAPHAGLGVPRETPPPATEGESKGRRARKAMQEYLTQRTFARRPELLDLLIKSGIMGHEKKPLKQLSTYLSRFPEFVSNGNGEWRLDRQQVTQNVEPSTDSPEGDP